MKRLKRTGWLLRWNYRNRVDYAKIDIEGAERELPRNDPTWLDMVGSLSVEIHQPEFFAEATQILQSRGFETRRDSRHWSTILGIR